MLLYLNIVEFKCLFQITYSFLNKNEGNIPQTIIRRLKPNI